MHLFSFALFALPVVLREKSEQPGLIFAVEPTLFADALVTSNGKVNRMDSWLHFQDFELVAELNLWVLKRIPFIEKMVRIWESRLYRRFGTISIISRAMMSRLIEKRIDEEKIKYFSNWIDTQLIYPFGIEHRYREALALSVADSVVLYSGSIGRKRVSKP